MTSFRSRRIAEQDLGRFLDYLRGLEKPFRHMAGYDACKAILGGEIWRAQGLWARAIRKGWIVQAGVHQNGTWRLYRAMPKDTPARLCPTCRRSL